MESLMDLFEDDEHAAPFKIPNEDLIQMRRTLRASRMTVDNCIAVENRVLSIWVSAIKAERHMHAMNITNGVLKRLDLEAYARRIVKKLPSSNRQLWSINFDIA